MTDTPTPEAPVTEAGRVSARETMVHRLEAAVRRHGVTVAPNVWLDDLDAIEAEAVARDREALAIRVARERVAAMPNYHEHFVYKADVLRILEGVAEDEDRAAYDAGLRSSPAPTDREEAFRNALSTEHELRQPDHDQTVPPPPVGQEGYCWSCELLAAP